MTDEGRVTFRLMLAVLTTSFGCWFALGYAFVATNTPQTVLLQWIRGVKCNRLNNVSHLWCESVPAEEMLASNTELTVIWAFIGSLVSGGCFVSSWLANMFTDKFGLKNTILLTNVVSVLGAILGGLAKPLESYEVLIASRLLLGTM